MIVTIATDVSVDGWREVITRLGGSIFLTCEWLQTKGDDGGQTVYIQFTGEYGTTCAAGAGRSCISRWPILPLIDQSLVMETFPAVGNGGSRAVIEVVKILQTTARQKGYVFLNVRPFTSSLAAETLRNLGFCSVERWEVLVDLQEDEQTLWKALRSGHQYNVKKGQKAGLRLKVEGSPEAFIGLQFLQRASQSRSQIKGNEYAIGDLETYRRMQAALADRGMGRVFTVMDGEERIAAALITVFNRQAYYTLSGANPKGYTSGAPTFLLWEAALRLKDEGVSLFNLGGVPGEAADPHSPLHGLYQFKTGFSSQIVESAGGSCILRPNSYRVAQTIRRVSRYVRYTKHD